MDGANRTAELRKRAWLVVALFLASVAYGVMLLLAFEPEVQGLEPGELFARSDDARAFLLADLVFPILYGIGSPVAQWRFGNLLTGGRPPRIFTTAAVGLAGAAVFDLAENVLLLVAIESDSADLVDAAHVVAVPKIALFVIGALFALAVLARAIATLRNGTEAP